MVHNQVIKGVLYGIGLQSDTLASNDDANSLEFAWELDL